MKRFFKRILLITLCIAVTGCFIHLFPTIADMLLGSVRVEWVSELLSESFREKNELVVYEVEIEGTETFAQEAWLIGTVQKVKIPYTFTVRYAVDLENAAFEVIDNQLIILLPAPRAKYQQLIVHEDNVQKNDWLYPLTAERYAEIKIELENKLMQKYSENEACLSEAWNNAVYQVGKIFSSLAAQNLLANGIEAKIIMQ